MSPAFFETGGFVFQRYFFSSKMGHFGHLNRWVLFKWCHSSGRLGGFKSFFFHIHKEMAQFESCFLNGWLHPIFDRHPSKTLDPGPGHQFNGEDMNDMNKKTHWVVATQKVSEFSSRIPGVSWSKFDGSHIFQRG